MCPVKCTRHANHPTIHPSSQQQEEVEGLCSEIGTSASEGYLHELLYGNKVCVGVYCVCLLVYSTSYLWGKRILFREYIYSPYSTPYHSLHIGIYGNGESVHSGPRMRSKSNIVGEWDDTLLMFVTACREKLLRWWPRITTIEKKKQIICIYIVNVVILPEIRDTKDHHRL